MTDFFISYTSADKAWAEWIAYVLEEEGYKVLIQAWDFRPGSNFVVEMQGAAKMAGRTILVLSPDYLKSQFGSSEWAAAFSHDPEGLERKVVPVMIRPCEPPGLLKSIVYISLVDQDESAARILLLDGIRATRAKPVQRPRFPGPSVGSGPKPYPMATSSSRSAAKPYIPQLNRPATDADKRRFARETFQVIRGYFEAALREFGNRHDRAECDFQPNTATDFTAEIFLDGKSKAHCRIWQGGLLSTDGISFSEGRHFVGSDAINESLSVVEHDGSLYMTAMMAGFGHLEKQFDTSRMTQEQSADYLWRRFVAWLER